MDKNFFYCFGYSFKRLLFRSIAKLNQIFTKTTFYVEFLVFLKQLHPSKYLMLIIFFSKCLKFERFKTRRKLFFVIFTKPLNN